MSGSLQGPGDRRDTVGCHSKRPDALIATPILLRGGSELQAENDADLAFQFIHQAEICRGTFAPVTTFVREPT